MKLLDFYVLREFFGKFFASIFAFVAIFTIVDIVEHIDKIIDMQIPGKMVAVYYAWKMPWFFSIALPMTLLLATVFTFGLLQKRNEITAIKSSGVSIRRVSISLLILGMLFSLGSFWFDNFVVVKTQAIIGEIENEFFLSGRKKRKTQRQDVVRQIQKNEFLVIKKIDLSEGRANNISLEKIQNAKLQYRLDAPVMHWDSLAQGWHLPTFKEIYFKDEQLWRKGEDSLLRVGIGPEELSQESKKPEEMDYWQLQAFVEQLKRNGVNDPRWEVNLHFKTAFAGTSILMILFGLSLSIGKPRSSIALGLGLSIFVILLYYGAIKFGQTLGIKGVMEPWISVWAANIVFLFAGTVLYFKTRT